MKTTVKKLSDTKVQLSVSLKPSELAAAKQVSLAKLARNIKVPGFRKDKVPKDFFIEFAKGFFAHKSSIYHFARLQKKFRFEQLHLVFRAYQLYAHHICFFEGYRLLVVIEIARLHRSDFRKLFRGIVNLSGRSTTLDMPYWYVGAAFTILALLSIVFTRSVWTKET